VTGRGAPGTGRPGIGRLATAGLAVLGVINLLQGGWAWFAPRHFYDTFPGFGQRWTATYPPYNAHLITDLGATFIAFGVLLTLAALLRDRRVTVVVLVGVLVFSVLHLVFHMLHRDVEGGLPPASLVALVLGVLAPGVLLVLARRAGRRPA